MKYALAFCTALAVQAIAIPINSKSPLPNLLQTPAYNPKDAKRTENIAVYNHGLNHLAGEASKRGDDGIAIYKASEGIHIDRLAGEESVKRSSKREDDIVAYQPGLNHAAGEETADLKLAAYMPGGHFRDAAGEKTAIKRGEDLKLAAYMPGGHFRDAAGEKTAIKRGEEGIAIYKDTEGIHIDRLAGEESVRRSEDLKMAAYMPGGHFRDAAGEETAL
jgi:hypothetical protein